MEPGKITIYDIAREAGVSTATVSRVLSNSDSVSERTARAVRAVIDHYGYRPNSMARGLYRRTSNTIGIIMPDIENPYYAAMFTAAYEEAHLRGYATLMYRTSRAEKLDAAFTARLIERRLDGALILGGALELPDSLESAAPALNLLQRHMPIVTICPPIPGLRCINIHSNLKASVRQSIYHLYALGHRRIAFLGGSSGSRSAGVREQTFLEVMKALAPSTPYVYETGHTPQAGELGVARLLASLERASWPTALIAINDLVALGAMAQLRHMGLGIPEDVAVIGCDNQFFSPFTDPPLTTVDNHPGELCRLAMAQLLSVMGSEGACAPFTQVRESTLVIRESCGAHLGRRHFA